MSTRCRAAASRDRCGRRPATSGRRCPSSSCTARAAPSRRLGRVLARPNDSTHGLCCWVSRDARPNLPTTNPWILVLGLAKTLDPTYQTHSINRRIAAVGRTRDHLLEGIAHRHVEIDVLRRDRLEEPLVVDRVDRAALV